MNPGMRFNVLLRHHVLGLLEQIVEFGFHFLDAQGLPFDLFLSPGVQPLL